MAPIWLSVWGNFLSRYAKSGGIAKQIGDGLNAQVDITTLSKLRVHLTFTFPLVSTVWYPFFVYPIFRCHFIPGCGAIAQIGEVSVYLL